MFKCVKEVNSSLTPEKLKKLKADSITIFDNKENKTYTINRLENLVKI